MARSLVSASSPPCLGPRVYGNAAVAGGIAAVLAAIYTGFLFAQAKGRDFWLSPALPVHLLVQALLAGAASLAIVGVVVASNAPTRMLLHDVLLWSLLVHLFIILVGELWLARHARRCQGSKTYTPWPP